MTGQDIDKLFELLAIFRPGDKHLGDKQLRSAWLFVLKPYAPEDVREAVAQYFRESSYWPDVTDIAKRCPKIVMEDISGEAKRAYLAARNLVRLSEQEEMPLKWAYDRMPARSREVIDKMGGMEAFAPPESPVLRMKEFQETYRRMSGKP